MREANSTRSNSRCLLHARRQHRLCHLTQTLLKGRKDSSLDFVEAFICQVTKLESNLYTRRQRNTTQPTQTTMFPPARNGHRRLNNNHHNHTNDGGDEKKHSSKTIPIPIAVTLHNLMVAESLIVPSPNNASSTTKDDGGSPTDPTTTKPAPPPPPPSSASKWFRPDYDWKLVPKILLEIVAIVQDNRDDCSQKQQQEQIIVYSQTSDTQSIHPSWEHIDERIDLPDEWWLSPSTTTKSSDSDNEETATTKNHSKVNIYKSMRLRFTITPNKGMTDDDGNNDNNAATDNNKNVFLEVPLYPSKLERLTNNNEAPYDITNPDDLPLPPNACFVHYSDGSTRLPPSVYQILSEHRLIKTEPAHSKVIEDFSRFEDDVFSALDSVTPQKQSSSGGNRERIFSASSLLGEASSNSNSNRALNMATDLGQNSPQSRTVSFTNTEQDAVVQDLESEREFLLAMIAKEEAFIEEEMAELEEVSIIRYVGIVEFDCVVIFWITIIASLKFFFQDKKSLEIQLQEAKLVEQEIEFLQKETKNQQTQSHRDKFLMDAQCVKLLKELRTIYPLTLDKQKGYLIREMQIPVDIYTTAVGDDEISAALSFACHLIVMTSKYLNAPLPHRIFCNSSRSAIRHNGMLYPLFVTRAVEREQLERGMTLLGSNVDCMLLTYNVEFTPKSHILARLQRLFDVLIEGDEKENAFA